MIRNHLGAIPLRDTSAAGQRGCTRHGTKHTTGRGPSSMPWSGLPPVTTALARRPSRIWPSPSPSSAITNRFPHESYLLRLTVLRDQLKAGLSAAARPGEELEPGHREPLAADSAIRRIAVSSGITEISRLESDSVTSKKDLPQQMILHFRYRRHQYSETGRLSLRQPRY